MIRRGEVWWAELPDARGAEPGFRRPVLVVQANSFNRSRMATAVVAAITSNMRLADAPGNVRLTRRQTGLPKESVVNVSQILTLDRTFLTRKAGRVPAAPMEVIGAGLRLVLSL